MLKRTRVREFASPLWVAWTRNMRGVLWWVPAAALALAAMGWGAKQYLVYTLEAERSSQQDSKLALQQLEQELANERLKSNFLQKLPSSIAASDITAKIQRQLISHKLVLRSLKVASHGATQKSLANHEWTLTLRGTYPNIKSALAKLLIEAPSLRIQALQINKNSDVDLEAQVGLVQWFAPQSLAK